MNAFSNFHALRKIALRCMQASIVWALCSSVGWAEQADRDRPMNVEADRLQHDDNKKVSSFQGKVLATKGTLVLRGDTLEVREDDQGYQYGLVLPLAGQRVFFRQKREGLQEYMEGEAERIEYDGRKDRVTLTGRAELRRLRGTTLSDAIQGQVIVYDNLNDQFSVDGQARTQGSGSSGAAARVRAVLAPKPKEGTGR
jgi:lipopolysaccharide export system protein LptA